MPEMLSYNRGARQARDRGAMLRHLAFGCALIPLSSAIGLLAIWLARGGGLWIYKGWVVVGIVSVVLVPLGAILLLEFFQTGMPNLDRTSRFKRVTVCSTLLLSVWPMLGLVIYLWSFVCRNVKVELVNASTSTITFSSSFSAFRPPPFYNALEIEPGDRMNFGLGRSLNFTTGTYWVAAGTTTFRLTYPQLGYVPESGYQLTWDGQKWIQTR